MCEKYKDLTLIAAELKQELENLADEILATASAPGGWDSGPFERRYAIAFKHAREIKEKLKGI